MVKAVDTDRPVSICHGVAVVTDLSTRLRDQDEGVAYVYFLLIGAVLYSLALERWLKCVRT